MGEPGWGILCIVLLVSILIFSKKELKKMHTETKKEEPEEVKKPLTSKQAEVGAFAHKQMKERKLKPAVEDISKPEIKVYDPDNDDPDVDNFHHDNPKPTRKERVRVV
jgi:hypothetical protein